MRSGHFFVECLKFGWNLWSFAMFHVHGWCVVLGQSDCMTWLEMLSNMLWLFVACEAYPETRCIHVHWCEATVNSRPDLLRVQVGLRTQTTSHRRAGTISHLIEHATSELDYSLMVFFRSKSFSKCLQNPIRVYICVFILWKKGRRVSEHSVL